MVQIWVGVQAVLSGRLLSNRRRLDALHCFSGGDAGEEGNDIIGYHGLLWL